MKLTFASYKAALILAATVVLSTHSGYTQTKRRGQIVDAGRALRGLQYDIAPKSKFSDAPKLLRGSAPSYPSRELMLQERGRAVIDFTIDPTGKTTNFRVARSSSPAFAAAAIAAIRSWRFQPAQYRGRPVAVGCRAPFSFTLDTEPVPENI